MTVSSSPQIEDRKFWTSEIAAEFLSVPKSYIYSLVRQQLIPFYRPIENGKIFFLESDLVGWLLNSKVDVKKEPKWDDEAQRAYIKARLNNY